MWKKILLSILVIFILGLVVVGYFAVSEGYISFGGDNRTNRPVQTVVHSDRDLSSAGETVIQWRGDRTGIFHETDLLTSWGENQPQLLWHFDGLENGFSSPAIANGKIYITGTANGRGFLNVLDLNGNLLNRIEHGAEFMRSFDGTRGTITISEGKLFFISGQGVIYCFDKNTLRLIWEKNMLEAFDVSNLTWGITESPLIVGNKIIATPGGERYNVVALNKNTGELVWSTPGMGSRSAYCSPIFIDTQEIPLIVQMTGLYTLGIHADTGEMLWAYPFSNNRNQIHPNTPVYSNGMILLTARGSVMLRLVNGGRAVETVWENIDFKSPHGGVVRVGNYAFIGGDDRERNARFRYCVNWYTGEVMWRTDEISQSTIIADGNGMLYFYTTDGEVVLVRSTPERFEIAGRLDITLGTDQHWTHPVIYNGMLLVRRGDTLMAFDIGG